MPYIKPERRVLPMPKIENVGDLTYIFYVLSLKYFKEHHNFQGIADIRAALLSTFDEFNRRYAHPYEDQKIKENGDVF